MSRNFHVVSMCISGKGIGPGKKAFLARCSITAESLPIEYSITGRSISAATSRKIWIASASSDWRWVRRAEGVGSVTPIDSNNRDGAHPVRSRPSA